jgi:very-short-patch-repair endonuclease
VRAELHDATPPNSPVPSPPPPPGSDRGERRLWARLRFRQLGNAKFRRQHPIGRFITDFCCIEHGLVIELDGSQHAEQEEADLKRSAFLARRGYRVVRFWDHEVIEDIEAVLLRILEALENPHPSPLPQGEGEERLQRKVPSPKGRGTG